MCNVVRRWQHKQLRRAWRAWEVVNRHAAEQEVLQEAAEQRAQRREQSVQRAIGRLRHRRLFLAFSGLRSGVAHARTQRQRLEGIVRRIQQRGKSKALRSWTNFCQGRKLLRRVLVHMAARVVHKELLLGFSTWERWVADERPRRVRQGAERAGGRLAARARGPHGCG